MHRHLRRPWTLVKDDPRRAVVQPLIGLLMLILTWLLALSWGPQGTASSDYFSLCAQVLPVVLLLLLLEAGVFRVERSGDIADTLMLSVVRLVLLFVLAFSELYTLACTADTKGCDAALPFASIATCLVAVCAAGVFGGRGRGRGRPVRGDGDDGA